MRILSLVLLMAVSGGAQISLPRIGYVRDASGTLRPLLGVGGAFVLGEAVERRVRASHYDGTSGCIQMADGRTMTWTGDADTRREAGDPQAACTISRDLVELDGDEVVVVRTGARIRVDGAIESIERAGRDWVVLRCPNRLLLLRIAAGKEKLFALPEAQE